MILSGFHFKIKNNNNNSIKCYAKILYYDNIICVLINLIGLTSINALFYKKDFSGIFNREKWVLTHKFEIFVNLFFLDIFILASWTHFFPDLIGEYLILTQYNVYILKNNYFFNMDNQKSSIIPPMKILDVNWDRVEFEFKSKIILLKKKKVGRIVSLQKYL